MAVKLCISVKYIETNVAVKFIMLNVNIFAIPLSSFYLLQTVVDFVLSAVVFVTSPTPLPQIELGRGVPNGAPTLLAPGIMTQSYPKAEAAIPLPYPQQTEPC